MWVDEAFALREEQICLHKALVIRMWSRFVCLKMAWYCICSAFFFSALTFSLFAQYAKLDCDTNRNGGPTCGWMRGLPRGLSISVWTTASLSMMCGRSSSTLTWAGPWSWTHWTTAIPLRWDVSPVPYSHPRGWWSHQNETCLLSLILTRDNSHRTEMRCVSCPCSQLRQLSSQGGEMCLFFLIHSLNKGHSMEVRHVSYPLCTP